MILAKNQVRSEDIMYQSVYLSFKYINVLIFDQNDGYSSEKRGVYVSDPICINSIRRGYFIYLIGMGFIDVIWICVCHGILYL